MKDNQKVFLNALNCLPGIGYHTLKELERFFGGDFEAAFKASEGRLKMAGLRSPEHGAVISERGKVDPEKEFKKLEEEGTRMITPDEKGYPRILKEIPLAPLFLYVKGELKPEDDFAFGVVGTRLATDYGKETAHNISFKLAQTGLTVVSGMAYGVDTQAHKGAIAAGGRTIAVLGCGLDDRSIFPRENLKLAHKIIENGALVSEYPFGMGATPEKFIQRNRIISGLSKGVLIVEAPLRSGALITARYALEQNRDVFAVPGNIFSRMSFGTNLLIKQGAAMVTRVEDILEELNIRTITESDRHISSSLIKFKPASKVEEKIFNILNEAGEPRHLDEITRNSELPIQKISAALTSMEMRGVIKNLGGSKFALTKPVIDDEEILE